MGVDDSNCQSNSIEFVKPLVDGWLSRCRSEPKLRMGQWVGDGRSQDVLENALALQSLIPKLQPCSSCKRKILSSINCHVLLVLSITWWPGIGSGWWVEQSRGSNSAHGGYPAETWSKGGKRAEVHGLHGLKLRLRSEVIQCNLNILR